MKLINDRLLLMLKISLQSNKFIFKFISILRQKFFTESGKIVSL